MNKYSTVQHSIAQYSTVQYSTVQYSTVQYSTLHTQGSVFSNYKKVLTHTQRSAVF